MSNYSYFLDKLVQTTFLSATISIMVNINDYIFTLFFTILFSLIILDSLQGKITYAYYYPQDFVSNNMLNLESQPEIAKVDKNKLSQNSKFSNTSMTDNESTNPNQKIYRDKVEELASEIKEFKNRLKSIKNKSDNKNNLTGGSYYPLI